jgi:CheY-like chemotaxis protein
MPVMDGLDAASKIFEMGVNTPIVALTANVMSNDLELYKISGMSDTVGKPFTTQELWRCLVKYIPVESYSVVDKIRQSAEEEKMQKQLCINFVKNNQNTQSEFIKALNEGDNVLAHRIVHTLKSNAGQIGEKRLQTAAAVAENVLAEGISLLTKEQTRSLELELNIVLEKLMPLLTEAMSSGESEPIDTGKALEILDKLEPLLDNSDTDCLNLVGDLHGIPGADELIHQIEGYKFKPALITLNNLRRELKKKHE